MKEFEFKQLPLEAQVAVLDERQKSACEKCDIVREKCALEMKEERRQRLEDHKDVSDLKIEVAKIPETLESKFADKLVEKIVYAALGGGLLALMYAIIEKYKPF